MNRFRKRSWLSGIPTMHRLGFLALMGFALFVSFRIFTPPAQTVQILEAPDGSRTARLERVYYVSDPGLKVAVRKNRFWRTLTYIPAITNLPSVELDEQLLWSADSKQLILEINDSPVWSRRFRD